MQHSYIDRYAGLNSFLHKIDPRIKIITFFIFTVSIVLTGQEAYTSFLLYASVLLFLIFASKVPVLSIFKKSLAVIPFVVLVAMFMPFMGKGKVLTGYSFGNFTLGISSEGVRLFWSVLIKAYLAVLSMILLTSSTKFTNFLKGLEKLKIPRIFILIASFMYRYSFLLVDEAQRMQRAKEVRTFEKRKASRAIKTLSNIIGVLFIRSYERAERVYLAMCSRGFQGEITTLDTLKIGKIDILFLAVISAVLILIRYV